MIMENSLRNTSAAASIEVNQLACEINAYVLIVEEALDER